MWDSPVLRGQSLLLLSPAEGTCVGDSRLFPVSSVVHCSYFLFLGVKCWPFFFRVAGFHLRLLW